MSNQKATRKAELSAVDSRADRRRFAQADASRLIFQFLAPAGTKVEDLQRPTFFAPVSGQLRPWCRIEVAEETGAFWAELLVLSANGLMVHTSVLREHKLPGIGAHGNLPPLADGLVIRYLGDFRKWGALRGDQILRDGFESQEAVRRWAESYSMAVKPSGDAA